MEDLKQSDHIVSGYDKDLASLNACLVEMSELTYSMTSGALKALKNADTELAQEVIERDGHVNMLEETVNEDAQRIMALRQPMASDLRLVISAIRMAADLERIGDLAESIGRRVLDLQSTKYLKLAKGVLRMGKAVKAQLKKAKALIKAPDAETAIKIWKRDSDIDDLYDSVFRELLTYMIEDSRNISACTGLLFVAKNLERIGDHVNNLCESVYYTATGTALIKDPRLSDDGDDEDDDD